MINTIQKECCCGCGACSHACPKHCISMIPDSEGFYYPRIKTDECINCHKCERVCPFININLKDRTIRPFGAITRDKRCLMHSSSGGIFSVLAETTINNGGCVYGVTMTEDCREVEHISVDSIENLGRLQGSKYLQSKPFQLYYELQNNLKQGICVLYSGTPCQIASLKNYLGNEYDNLICVDVVCHGVPSQLLWSKYVDEIETKNESRVVRVNFRDKSRGWKEFGLRIDLENGKSIYRSKDTDPYLLMFLRNCNLRSSCYNCKPKEFDQADITLADFWGIERCSPQYYDPLGVSLVIVRSEKGMKYITSLSDSMQIFDVDFSEAIKSNIVEHKSVSKPILRNEFYNDLLNISFKDLTAKYASPDYLMMIKKRMASTKLWKMLKQY